MKSGWLHDFKSVFCHWLLPLFRSGRHYSGHHTRLRFDKFRMAFARHIKRMNYKTCQSNENQLLRVWEKSNETFYVLISVSYLILMYKYRSVIIAFLLICRHRFYFEIDFHYFHRYRHSFTAWRTFFSFNWNRGGIVQKA